MHPTSQRVTPDHATREPQNAGLESSPGTTPGKPISGSRTVTDPVTWFTATKPVPIAPNLCA